MHEATFGQLDLESIFALWLRAMQRRVGRFLENGLRHRLTCEFTFGLCRPPRLRADATQRDASARYFSVGNCDYYRGGSEREFVGSAVAQF